MHYGWGFNVPPSLTHSFIQLNIHQSPSTDAGIAEGLTASKMDRVLWILLEKQANKNISKCVILYYSSYCEGKRKPGCWARGLEMKEISPGRSVSGRSPLKTGEWEKITHVTLRAINMSGRGNILYKSPERERIWKVLGSWQKIPFGWLWLDHVLGDNGGKRRQQAQRWEGAWSWDNEC